MLMLLLGVCMVAVLFLHILSQTVAGVSKVYFFFLSIFGTLFNPLEAMISWLGIFTFEPTQTVPYCPVEMDEYGKFLMLIVVPGLFGVLLGLMTVLHCLMDRSTICQRCCTRCLNKFPFQPYKYRRTGLAMLIFSYTHFADTYLKFLQCVPLEADPALPNGSVSVVREWPAMICESNEYNQYLPFVWTALVLNVIGLPIFITVYLRRRAKRSVDVYVSAADSPSSEVADAASILYEDYVPRAYLYEGFAILRRVMVSAVDVGLAGATMCSIDHVLYLCYCSSSIKRIHMRNPSAYGPRIGQKAAV